MGTTTPNIGLFIPADGETNYGTAFANGMLNLDTHDHSGAPSKGVPLSSAGIANGSITAVKLNADVVSPGGGLSFDINNALQTDGVLKALHALGSNGILVRTSSTTAAARTLASNTAQITITNPDGVAGNPSFALASSFFSEGTTPAAAVSNAGAINGYSTTFNTITWQRIGNWLLFDYEINFSGTGGPAGDMVLNLPFIAVGTTYWFAGYFNDGTTQTVVNYQGNGTIIVGYTIGSPPATVVQIPAIPFTFNVQFSGVYKIA